MNGSCDLTSRHQDAQTYRSGGRSEAKQNSKENGEGHFNSIGQQRSQALMALRRQCPNMAPNENAAATSRYLLLRVERACRASRDISVFGRGRWV
jgi:hypothetical protein